MAVTATAFVVRTPAVNPGVYSWTVGSTLAMDCTGGLATSINRFASAAENSLMLWYYLTNIFHQVTGVAAQAAHVEIDPSEWSNLGAAVPFFIGFRNQGGDAGQGGSPLADTTLPMPLFLGQTKDLSNVDINFITDNTDTGDVQVYLKGFALQSPISEAALWLPQLALRGSL